MVLARHNNVTDHFLFINADTSPHICTSEILRCLQQINVLETGPTAFWDVMQYSLVDINWCSLKHLLISTKLNGVKSQTPILIITSARNLKSHNYYFPMEWFVSTAGVIRMQEDPIFVGQMNFILLLIFSLKHNLVQFST